jgi:glycosyltransferase involved in cell wall biosynthesis
LFSRFDLVHTFGRMNNIALLMFSRLPKVVSYQLSPTVSQVKKAMKIAPHNSLHFTACSDYIKKQIEAYAPATTIYNGVDVNNYQLNTIVPADAPLVFLGRIQKEKGTAIAIEVAQRTGHKLVIAGNIPNEAHHQLYFNEQVKPAIDNGTVTYIGPVNDVQKNELLRNAAALLMPVLWDEPFGIVMVEALACGTPVIGFRRGAIPEVVSNGVNGFVCDNTTEMITAVGQLDKIERQKCRDVAVEKFSSTVLARQYEALYQKITAKN